MRQISSAMQAKLDSGVTTFCWCWKVTRRDDSIFGFTDHDRDLTVDGVVFKASTADASAESETTLGFGVDTSSTIGVLCDETITDADIANGLFDGARVETLLVDWSDPTVWARVSTSRMGDIKRSEHGYETELRGPTALLSRSIGRVVQRRCDAELGDARCGVDLTDPAYKAVGVVTSVSSSRSIDVSGLGGFASGWFDLGVLTWTTGDNAPAIVRVTHSRPSSSAVRIELASALFAPIAIGDAFEIVSGCDKRWNTCVEKFENFVNFRGFPMLPGNDWLQAGVAGDTVRDGRSMWDRRSD